MENEPLMMMHEGNRVAMIAAGVYFLGTVVSVGNGWRHVKFDTGPTIQIPVDMLYPVITERAGI